MIFAAVLNHLWQSTAFAIAAALLTLALRKNRAHTRYCLWFAASVKFLVPFAALAGLGAQIASVHPPVLHRSLAQARISFAIEETSAPFSDPLPPASRVPPLPPFWLLGCAAVWLLGCAAVALSWFLRWRRIRHAVRVARPLALDNGNAIGVPLRTSRALLEPSVFGIARPVLLLPEGIADRLTPQQLQAIVAHELCHVRRRDNLAAAIHMSVQAIFWFHPLVWWIGARLIEERERACDEDVLRLGNDPEVYAESILRACRFYLESPVACVSGVTGGSLTRRIEQIMTQHIGGKLNLGRKFLLAAAALIAMTAPVFIGLSHVPLALAQTPPPAFEVAAIKPSKPGSTGSSILWDMSGRLTVENASLKRLIWSAYDVRDFQIVGGPPWLDSGTFDIVAKPEGPTNQDQKRAMQQKLLADRFHLKLHRENREMPVYELLVAKPGFKLREAANPRHGIAGRANAIESNGSNIAALAETLARKLRRTVLDKTGLTGFYDYKLEFSLDPATDGTALPSIFTALQEQLGLRLESAKGPVEILVVDHAEKPSEN
jgi:bla regulator protein BlaR1